MIKMKVVDGSFPKVGLFLGAKCMRQAVLRTAARHTITHNHSVTDNVLVVAQPKFRD